MTPEESFIQEYLVFDQDLSHESFEKMIETINTLKWELVEKHILRLNYYNYLKTSLWRIVSEEVKRRNNHRCSQCGSREKLQVHHTNYNIHGKEHTLVSLLCLCNKCHQAQHQEIVTARAQEIRRSKNQKKSDILEQIQTYPYSTSEDELSGSFMANRKLLEELERENKIVINKNVYTGWTIRQNV